MEDRHLCLSADDIFCIMHQVPPWSSAPVSLPAGVHLRATLYEHVGISDLSILHRRKPTLGLASLLLGKRSTPTVGFRRCPFLRHVYPIIIYSLFWPYIAADVFLWQNRVWKRIVMCDLSCRLQRIGTIKEDVHKKRFFWKIPRLILVL